MKLWRARLNLICEDGLEYKKDFKVLPMDSKDYEANNTRREWVRGNGRSWLIHKLPMDMDIRLVMGAYVVEKGFDREPTKEEELAIEKDMEKYLIDYLSMGKDEYLKVYDSKGSALIGQL